MILRRFFSQAVVSASGRHDVVAKPHIPVKRIFSGIQPTGQIHIGNYFGAIRQWVEYQNNPIYANNTFYCIVDLHSITLPQKPESLEAAILEAAATLLACGIDTERSTLFLQSHVPAHTQLSWVLGSLTTMPRLAQLPQFKEKSKNLKEVPLGLYTYPVLQAADILLYSATDVPIGEDNLQHIHLAQHLARRFNRIYSPILIEPKPIIGEGMSARIRSLRKPENKMSKSEPDPKSRIFLGNSPDEIVEILRKAVTDITPSVTYDIENRPGVSNLIQIHSLCTGQSIEDTVQNASHLQTGEYKLVVAEALIEFLKPIRSKLLELLTNPGDLIRIVEQGSVKAREVSDPIWDSVCYQVGISSKRSWYTPLRPPARLKV